MSQLKSFMHSSGFLDRFVNLLSDEEIDSVLEAVSIKWESASESDRKVLAGKAVSAQLGDVVSRAEILDDLGLSVPERVVVMEVMIIIACVSIAGAAAYYYFG